LKKLLLILAVFATLANASYEKGKKIFNNKCVTCHVEYIPVNLLIDNFKNHKNKLLNLKAPSFNRIAYKILSGRKAIGSSADDLDIRREAIEEYLMDYLNAPTFKKSVSSLRSRKHYPKKIPMKNITLPEYKYLVTFIMEFKKNHDFTVKKNDSKINEKKILRDAKKLNKYIIVEATSKDCHYCAKMKKEVLKLKDVKKSMNKDYIFVEANIDKTNLPFDLEKDFPKITPTFFFLDENAKLIKLYPGAWKKSDFLNMLNEHKKK